MIWDRASGSPMIQLGMLYLHVVSFCRSEKEASGPQWVTGPHQTVPCVPMQHEGGAPRVEHRRADGHRAGSRPGAQPCARGSGLPHPVHATGAVVSSELCTPGESSTTWTRVYVGEPVLHVCHGRKDHNA